MFVVCCFLLGAWSFGLGDQALVFGVGYFVFRAGCWCLGVWVYRLDVVVDAEAPDLDHECPRRVQVSASGFRLQEG